MTKKTTVLTAFEWQALQAALAIPLGETRSYQWVAERIGRPRAVRAVGQALRKNPYPLIIPCHRVVRSDGTPGGYAGAYDGRKERLLKTEQVIAQRIAALTQRDSKERAAEAAGGAQGMGR